MKPHPLRTTILTAIIVTAGCDLSNLPRGAANGQQHAHRPAMERPTSLHTSPAEGTTASPAASSNRSTVPAGGDPAHSCAASDVQVAISQQLFVEREFHDYICEEQPCTEAEFLAGLAFDDVVLRDAPRTFGCIVGPLHPAQTAIYGVFLLQREAPSLVLTYLGIAISVDPAFKKPGFKDLIATERLDPYTWVTHRYVWSNRGYALESTTKDVEPP